MIEQQLTKVLATTAIALCGLTVASGPSYGQSSVSGKRILVQHLDRCARDGVPKRSRCRRALD